MVSIQHDIDGNNSFKGEGHVGFLSGPLCSLRASLIGLVPHACSAHVKKDFIESKGHTTICLYSPGPVLAGQLIKW